MSLVISKSIQKKLTEKHGVRRKEVLECFQNMTHRPIKDEREEHETNPPTMWIVSETNHRRELKVLFVLKDGGVYLKSAYEPSDRVKNMYYNNATPL